MVHTWWSLRWLAFWTFQAICYFHFSTNFVMGITAFLLCKYKSSVPNSTTYIILLCLGVFFALARATQNINAWHVARSSCAGLVVYYNITIKRDISRDKITLKTRLTEYICFVRWRIRLHSKKQSSFIIKIYRLYIGRFYPFSDNVRFREIRLPNSHKLKRNVSQPFTIVYNILTMCIILLCKSKNSMDFFIFIFYVFFHIYS